MTLKGLQKSMQQICYLVVNCCQALLYRLQFTQEMKVNAIHVTSVVPRSNMYHNRL